MLASVFLFHDKSLLFPSYDGDVRRHALKTHFSLLCLKPDRLYGFEALVPVCVDKHLWITPFGRLLATPNHKATGLEDSVHFPLGEKSYCAVKLELLPIR